MEEAKQPGVNILVCDDDPAFRKLVHTYLKSVPDGKFVLKEAGRKAEIQDALNNGALDLIFMDLRMPEKSGEEWLEEIVENQIAPVVMLTGFGNEEIAVQSLQKGAFDYVPKDNLTKDRLLGTIKATLETWKRKKAEEKYLKELERANRDLKNYAYTISHDLRDPLYSIQAFIGFLMRDYAGKRDGKGQNYLDLLKKASKEMVELIADLLLLSRVGRQYTEIETVDLNVLAEEIKTELKIGIEECGGEVVAEKLPTISTINAWMKELLMNLIDNGLKFNESEKPRVEISCKEWEREKDYLFMVKDNGIGIEEENRDKIFNLFDRLPLQLKSNGTGVGLSICKKIVAEFGGTIWVESNQDEGKGSTFCFTIPKLNHYFS